MSTALWLVCILAVVSIGATLVATAILYRAAVETQRARLTEIVQSRARLIEAIARSDRLHESPGFPGGPVAATLQRIRDAHHTFPGFGRTGEFAMAVHDKASDQIIFLLSHRSSLVSDPPPVPFSSALAEPMHQALLGRSGSMVGLDHRGQKVLAAFEPIDELGLGIIAKIDLAEVREPFISASVLAGASALLLVLAGTLGIFRITDPVNRQTRLRAGDLEQEIETRKGAVRAARQSEDDLNRAQAIARVGSWKLMFGAKESIWSEEACRIFGFTPGEYIAFDQMVESTLPSERALLEACWQSAQKDGMCELDHRILAEGRVRWVHSIIAVESDAQGKPVLAVGTVADITEAKDAEADRAYLEGQLRQSQKMETVGQLAGGIAHDFNNLLTAIQGYADMVYDSLDGNESAQADIKQIQLAAESAASLTQQLLAFSRKQIIAPCVLDLNRILAKSEKMVRRIIGEDLDLVWSPGKDLWKTKVDPGQIDQVLVNLAVNARDAVAEGGKLTIETANMVLDEKSCVTCYEPFCGNFVMMAVSDNGCGMDEATMGKAFDPFYTTKSEGQGTGLGLSTVLGIVHQNGGHINIYSEVGRGTSIKIYWPALFGADSIVPAAPEIQELGGTETILLVEDRDMVREVTQRSLERHGYEVIPACDGQAALAACARYGSAIDLLFTDVIMPGLNGRDLHRRICLMIPGLRVLYMSGYTDDAMAHHGVLDNGIHYLQKPFRERAMLQKVREVIEAPQA